MLVQAPGIVAARLPPKPLPKVRSSIGFLARLVFNKYGLGLPLARIIALLGAEGAAFAPGSLIGSLNRLGAGGLHNASSSHLHVDETSWKVFVLVPGKTNYRHWIWVFVGVDSVAFYLKPLRCKNVVVAHLGLIPDEEGRLCLPEGGELLVSNDFYTTYQSLGQEVDGLVSLCCCAHIRRYSIRCGDVHQSCRAFAGAWLEAIKALYRSWHACVAAEEKVEALASCREIVAEMGRRRKLQAQDATLPKAARKVLSTVEHEWPGLVSPSWTTQAWTWTTTAPSASTSWSTRRSWTTTSALSSRRKPRIVRVSTPPGPVPAR